MTKKQKMAICMVDIFAILVITVYMGLAMEGVITHFPEHGICALIPRDLWGLYLLIVDTVLGFALVTILEKT